MTPRHSDDVRTAREALADEAYCRLRALLGEAPAAFAATREGLAIDAVAVDAHLFDAIEDRQPLPRSTVIAGAKADGWLLRVTARMWLLHPEAFDCTEEPPAGVRDERWDCVDHPGQRETPVDAETWM